MTSLGRGAAPLAALLAGLLFAGLSAGYGERTFNFNDQTDAFLYQTVDDTHRVAQSFLPTESFVLSNVTLELENRNNAPALTVTIRPDTAGVPGGTILASSEQLGGSSRAWVDFPLSSTPTLLAGSTYWIVAENLSVARSYRWFQSWNDVVPGVVKVHDGSSWSSAQAPLDRGDLGYFTYGLSLEPDVELGISADRLYVPPGANFEYTIYLNNSGFLSPPNAWVNLTLAAEVLHVADTASSLGGTPVGTARWRFSTIGNGPHSFVVTVSVDGNTQSGRWLNASVRLEYSDSMGNPRPPSSVGASVIVAMRQKTMYLAYDGPPGRVGPLRAAGPTNPPLNPVPDFDADGSPGLTANSTAARWILDPPFSRPFRVRGTVLVDLYLTGLSGAFRSATLNVSLYDVLGASATLVVSAEVGVSVDDNASTYEVRQLDLGISDWLFLAGNATELRIQKVSGDDLWIGYDQSDLPSRVTVLTSTYISVDRIELRDPWGPATVFSPKDTLTLEANVSDPFGSGEVQGARMTIADPDGVLLVADAPLFASSSDPSGAWVLFRGTHANLTKPGSYTFLVTAREGNGVEASALKACKVEFPILQLSVSGDAPAPRPGDLVRFKITYGNVGTASASFAWLNVTLPSQLTYVFDSANATKAAITSWTFPNVPLGSHSFDLIVRVEGAPSSTQLSVPFNVTYLDDKGHRWVAPGRSVTLTVVLPPPPPGDAVIPAVVGAAVTGGLAAGYWLWRGRRPRIEEAFLIQRDGILLYHTSRSLRAEGDKDRDILGAMLTAVQEFVKDSFTYGEGRDLNKLEFGDYEVLFERGTHVFLAVVLSRGTNEVTIRRRLRGTLDEVENRYGTELEARDGRVDRLLGVRDIVRRLVLR